MIEPPVILAQPGLAGARPSAMSTAMQNWTTGPWKFNSNPVTYDLIGAKRFVRVAYQFVKNGYTTSTAVGTVDRLLVSGTLGVHQVSYPSADTTSSSTSTST